MNLDYLERPETLDEIIGHEGVKKDLKAYLKTGDPPHMIFTGPPGVGKNCLVYAFMTEYLGRKITLNTEDGDRDYKEVNCSLLTGIDVVREVLKEFMEGQGHTFKDSNGNSYNIDFLPEDVDVVRLKKGLFLNEFEQLSSAAKKAAKSMIEKNEENIIVFGATNYPNKIGEDALVSRCSVFNLRPPKAENIKSWFIKKSEKYGVSFADDDIVDEIVLFYKGDMRRMLVDCLEALRGYEEKDNIRKEHLHKIFGESRNYAKLVFESDNQKEMWSTLWKRDYFDNNRFLEEYLELIDSKYAVFVSKIDSRLKRGCNPMIQMSALFELIKDGSQ